MTPIIEFPIGEVFIETGFSYGHTLACALDHYNELHSIDIDASCIARGHQFQSMNNVWLHVGDSTKVLPQIINPDKKTVFWLDAHYSPAEGQSVPLDNQCPLMVELQIIKSFPWKVLPDIMIDDVVLFTAPDYLNTYAAGCDRAQFPNESDIVNYLSGYDHHTIGDRYYHFFPSVNQTE